MPDQDLPADKLAKVKHQTKDGEVVVLATLPDLDLTLAPGTTTWKPTSTGFKKEIDKKREHVKFHKCTARVSQPQLEQMKRSRQYGIEYISQDEWRKNRKEQSGRDFKKLALRNYRNSIIGREYARDLDMRVDELELEAFGV